MSAGIKEPGVRGKIPGMPGVRRTSYILWEISGGPGDTGYAFGLGIPCMPKGDYFIDTGPGDTGFA